MTVMTAPAAQIPGVYRRRIGDIVVTAISDGYLDASYDFMRNIVPQEAEQILNEAYRPAPPRVSINCFVLHSGGRVALVETGSGDKMGPTLGKMPCNLAAAGVDAASIDTILLTHMHPDHSNGLTDKAGAAVFPNAELVVSERDVDHWHDDAAMAVATRKRIFDQVATDRLLCAGMHMHFPGFLNLNRRPDGGYELVPEIWKQAL